MNYMQIIDLLNTNEPTPTTSNGNGQSSLDLMKDIFGDSGTSASPPPQQKSNVSSILDLFGSPPPSTSTPAATIGGNALLGDLGDLGGLGSPAPQLSAPAGPKLIPAYNKNDLSLELQLQRTPDGLVNIMARFRNTSFTSDITNVNLQAAVPKSQKLQLQPISSTDLIAGGEATQAMRVQGSKAVSKITYIFRLREESHIY